MHPWNYVFYQSRVYRIYPESFVMKVMNLNKFELSITLPDNQWEKCLDQTGNIHHVTFMKVKNFLEVR